MTAKRFVRLTPEQYQRLSALAREKRTCLELVASSEIGGAFGTFDCMVGDVFLDAADDSRWMGERIIIKLAIDIDVDRFRETARPEIDWSALADDEIHLFVLQHELGHRVDNYCTYDMPTRELPNEVREKCSRYVRWANEILADRYAWNMVRPGEQMPIGEHGRKNADLIVETLAFLDQHIPRRPYAPLPIDQGQYTCVPTRMLANDILAAYVGPEVHPSKIARAKEMVERTRERLGLPIPAPLFEAGPGDIILTNLPERAAA